MTRLASSMARVASWLIAAAVAGVVGAPGAAAQSCPVAAARLEARLIGGLARYDIGSGSDGVELGVEGAWRPRGLELRLSASRVLIDGGSADPTLIRASAARPLLARGRLSLCGAALGGLSHLSAGDDRALTVSGGAELRVGARLPLGGGALTPTVAVRGLGAHTSGDVLGLGISASGAAAGVEGGATLEVGRLVAGASASLDGLDPGLGATPYPARAFRLALGWRF